MQKIIILENCNQLSLERILQFIQSDVDFISIEEFIDAGLDEEMIKKVELAICNSLDFNQLILFLNNERFTLKDFEEAGLEYEKLKLLQLQFCNTIEIADLLNIIQSERITIDEFKNAGLDEIKLNAINKVVKPLVDKAIFLNEINNKTAFDIRVEINNENITFDDLRSCLDEDIVNALKNYHKSAQEDMPFYKISDFEPLKSNKTDLLFIGLPNAGKSTMLAGISLRANQLGYLFSETSNISGVKYQDKLIFDLEQKLLPAGTLKGSYNFIATNFNANDIEDHPYNIIEVPGENYDTMYDQGQANDFLNFISNSKNKKIFIFVIDSNKKEKQESIFTTILNLINDKGILNRTAAIYIVVNKFDNLIKNDSVEIRGSDEDIAFEFLNDNYITFIKTLRRKRRESDNKFKIKILPFSIGTVVHGSILKSFNKKYSEVLIDHLIFDSFYIKLNK